MRRGQDGAVKRNWRRTSFKRLDGSIDVAPDDWPLFDDNGRPLARIYITVSARMPDAAGSFWSRRYGVPANGGTGVADTGREAREICERVLPLGTAERPFARMEDA